jgi:hypothetical protein
MSSTANAELRTPGHLAGGILANQEVMMHVQLPERFTKRYTDPVVCARAAANYRWLEQLSSPMQVPELLGVHKKHLDFTFSAGAAVGLGDLLTVAEHLGDVHGAIFRTTLHRARLTTAHVTGDGHRIRSFFDQRLAIVRRRLTLGMVPSSTLNFSSARDHLIAASGEPVALYKDSNPRNFLITNGQAPVTIDFDDVTLAPFGYDLAKLVVTLAMTHGRVPASLIGQALDVYNNASHRQHHALGEVTAEQFLIWAEFHHILTSPYLGRGGYIHSWNELRPQAGQLSG